jgi:hypothetical protein
MTRVLHGLVITLVVLWSAACMPSIPSGIFKCTEDRDCPSALHCHMDGYCYSDEEDASSGEPDASEDGTSPVATDVGMAAAVDANAVTNQQVDANTDVTGHMDAGDGGDSNPALGMDATREAGAEEEAALPADAGSGAEGGEDGGAEGGEDGGGKPDADGGPPLPFRLVSSTPSDQGTLAGFMATISLTFSADVDAATISTGQLRLRRGSEMVSGSLQTAGKTVTFTPRERWPCGAFYTLELSADIHDVSGRALVPTTLRLMAPEGTWQSMRFADADSASAAGLAVSSSGYAALVFVSTPPAGSNIFVSSVFGSRYTPAGSWSPPKALSTKPPDSRGQVAINDVGLAVAAWEVFPTNDPYLEVSSHNGTDWLPVRRIDYAREQQVLVTPSGLACVVYVFTGVPWSISGYYFAADGTGSSSSEHISQGNTDAGSVTPEAPQAAVLGNSCVVSWSERTNAGTRSVWTDAPGIPRGSLSDPGLNASDVDVAADATASSAMIAFQQVDPDWQNIHAMRLTAGGTLAKSTVISDRTSAASAPSVAVDRQGGALAAWLQSVSGRKQIMAASFTANAWKPAQLISDDTLGEAYSVAVALEPGGNGFVVWTQAQASDAAKVSLWVARYVAGRGFDAASRKKLSQSESVSRALPTIGIDKLGHAFAAWTEGAAVWVARFE